MAFATPLTERNAITGNPRYCRPTPEDNAIFQRHIRRLDRWDRAAGQTSDFIVTVNRACHDYTEQN